MTIVISGSMVFINDMQRYAEVLNQNNINVILPEEDDWENILESEINEYKKRVSALHFSKISSASTDGVLIINKSKNNIDNYIGANTFAEIAIAFYFNKKIYLLNDYYEPYKDELKAWGAIPLKNNLHNMFNCLNE